MNTGQQLLLMISALGACNGLILGLYLLFNRKGRPLWTFFLGLMLLMISLRVAKSVFFYFNPDLPKPCLQTGLSACFLIGPSLFYMLLSARNNGNPVPKSWKVAWGVLLGIIVIGGIFISYEAYPKIWNKVIAYIIYAQWFLYLIASVYIMRGEIGKVFGGKVTVLERQMLSVLAGNLILYFFYALALFRFMPAVYIAAAVSFTFILYVTIFVFFYGAGSKSANPQSPKRKIPDADAQSLLEKLSATMAVPDVYKDPNLKLGDLAQRLHVTPHLLSQLLNDNLGKSFSAFVNEHRIGEACRLITANDHLTFEAIGYEVGFNSKSTFYAAFRKVTGTTPALFRENLAQSPSRQGS
ncbi:AraC family transcriptional regulator [Chitinophaga rhizosphaerae]|uniref:AraC family transcriptional regulator n=1 Tax=Chitinophaga rhizosphaerae TaxID=1864947 RepID=UPI000F801EEF|nr:helix-turn-helix domain-containing protein [Chitinophaga rhizosphaerae]